jgi:glycosyltransferase involved in cell wall biosynthesis
VPTPLVSIIIPAYNGELYLREAIESILAQDYKHYEILVLDNGSKDRTAEIAQSFPQVQYTYSEKADTALARNRGVTLARGEYLALLDQDDTWTPDKLTKQVQFLESQQHYGAVIGLQRMYLQAGYSKPHWLKQAFLEKPQFAYLPSALMIRRSAFSITDNFNTAFPFTSDVLWFMKAHHQGIPIGILDEVIVHRRIHEDNASNKHLELQKELLAAIKYSLAERRTK